MLGKLPDLNDGAAKPARCMPIATAVRLVDVTRVLQPGDVHFAQFWEFSGAPVRILVLLLDFEANEFLYR